MSTDSDTKNGEDRGSEDEKPTTWECFGVTIDEKKLTIKIGENTYKLKRRKLKANNSKHHHCKLCNGRKAIEHIRMLEQRPWNHPTMNEWLVAQGRMPELPKGQSRQARKSSAVRDPDCPECEYEDEEESFESSQADWEYCYNT
eukprot:857043_1